MEQKNWKWYIDNNDLLGCYERYKKARTNWKAHWWKTIEEIFKKSKEWAKKYVLDPVKRTIERIGKKPRKSKYDVFIQTNGLNINEENKQLCYLFRFYDKDHNLLCSKVGTTTRSVKKRLIEELNNKTYQSMGAMYVEIDRIYDCGDLPAEGLESLIRSQYIKKYPKSFYKNDRFIGELFDLEYCDTITKEYLAV